MHTAPTPNPLSRPWLLLATGSIALSALFAILLVVARTPGVQSLFGLQEAFHTVLVLHVNFSVLVWLLSFGALLWSLTLRRFHPVADPFAFGLVIAGALLLSLSPLLTPPPQPVMSNYIPILHSPAFLTGLCAFAMGIGLYAVRRLLSADPDDMPPSGRLSALSLLTTLIVFAITAWRLPQPIESPAAFEALFWGGGHLLQFVYLLLLLACWQRLHPVPWSPLARRLTTALTLLLLATGLGVALLLEPGSNSYRAAFTQLMRFGTPLLLLPALFATWQHGLPGGLRLSRLLLLAGLGLGALISGDNVSVTAHYHATNAAITLAFMALSYRLFEQLELGRPSQHWAWRQQQGYFAAMAIYITGMALSGQLDVPRKVAMVTEGQQAIAMALMGAGGLLATVATLAFVAVLLHAARHRHLPHQQPEQGRPHEPTP